MCPNDNCHDEGPCPMPPHPLLLDRLREEGRLGSQQGDGSNSVSSVVSRRLGLPLSAPTGTKFGLNDGTIFPESRFHGIVSKHAMSRAALERTPLRGPIKAAIVLVDFSDQQMGSDRAQYFNDLFFSTGKVTTGSVTEYYTDVSGGKISLAGEVLGPFRMPLTLKKYTHGESGFSDAEPNLQTLAGHALDAANSHIDLKPYDNDGNGQVDAFIVVHAGAGAEVDRDVNKIWSAKWNLVGEGQNVDGVNVFAFLTIPEDARLGVCAHELGHLLFGWPDFYDIDLPENQRDPNRIGIRSAGIGSWCLMAGGSWGRLPGTPRQDAGNTPCHPSAWCKVNQGWVTLLNETNNRSVSLKDVKGPPSEVHRLWTNGDLTSKEYFLMENRQLEGFDRSLPGPGLLVWHADDTKTNNRNEDHQWVGLMESDGLREMETSGWRGDAGDPFPGTSRNTSFTNFSNPSSASYAGRDTGVSITNISQSGPTMTMKVTVRPPGPRL